VQGCALPASTRRGDEAVHRCGESTPALWADRRAPDGHLNSRFATLVFRYDPARDSGVSPGSIRKKEDSDSRPRHRPLQ